MPSSPATTSTPAVSPQAADQPLTVSDVAEQSGVAASAVRFYEKHGVITAVRTAGNQRRFDTSAPCRIHVARLAQRVGLTIREIADLFASLPPDPRGGDWGQVSDRLIADAEQRVNDLKAHLAALDSGARLCEIGEDLLAPAGPGRE